MRNSLKGCPSYNKEEKWCRVYGNCTESCNIRKTYECLQLGDIKTALKILEGNSHIFTRPELFSKNNSLQNT